MSESLVLLIAFFVFFGMIGRKLFAFVVNALDKKRDLIKSRFDDVDRLYVQTESLSSSYKEMLDGIDDKVSEMLSDTEQKKRAIEENIEKKIKDIRERMVREEKERAEFAAEKVRADLVKLLMDVSTTVIGRIISENLSSEGNDRFIISKVDDIKNTLH